MASIAMMVSELAHSLGQPNNHALRENLKLLVIQTRNEVIRRSYENHGYVDKGLTQRLRYKKKKLINANGAKKHTKLAFSPLLYLFIYRRGAWTYDTPSSSSFSLSIPFPFLLFERKSQKFLAVSIKKRIFAADFQNLKQ